MTTHDLQHFDVEASIAPDVTLPDYRAARTARRPWWRVILRRKPNHPNRSTP